MNDLEKTALAEVFGKLRGDLADYMDQSVVVMDIMRESENSAAIFAALAGDDKVRMIVTAITLTKIAARLQKSVDALGDLIEPSLNLRAANNNVPEADQ